ncbi:MAG TPA: hypothetical protein VGF13_05435 [Verrucomicrobiae bacterium]|jgi:hypothetical protein
MADETKTLIVTQPKDATFNATHTGHIGLHGIANADPLKHCVNGEVSHSGNVERPLVHMVLWDEDCACEINGRVTVAGDPQAPVEAVLHHRFENDHAQTLSFKTALAEPIHHALQMRTPLQVRFCNAWHVASDYTIEINLGRNRLIGVRLTGATIARPQPCEGETPCPPPVITQPVHP